MNTNRRRYTMYPQKTFAGYVETESLENGYLKVYMTLDGASDANEILIDTNNANEMRAFSQLHLVPVLTAEEDVRSSAYMIEGHVIPGVRAVADAKSKKVIIGRSRLN